MRSRVINYYLFRFLLGFLSVFMAKHLDRHYCGRCAFTLKLDAEAIKAA